MRERHAATLFSDDGTSIDEQVAALLLRAPARTIATAESCTGGLVAARLTDRPGSSAYVRGGLVVYSNDAKTGVAGVDPALIEEHGAVSPEVARALADGAIARSAPTSASGSPGSPGPTAAPRTSPSGSCGSRSPSAAAGGSTRRLNLPGARADVRDRSTTVALHLLRRVLLRPRRPRRVSAARLFVALELPERRADGAGAVGSRGVRRRPRAASRGARRPCT